MKHRSLSTLFAICLTCFVGFSTPSLHAFLASVKNAGMGLTGVAHPQDAMTGAFNPANICDVGDRIDIGLTWDHFQGKGIISGNLSPAAPLINGSYEATRRKDFFSPDVGIVKGYCFSDWDLDFAVGLVVYNKDFAKTSYTKKLILAGTRPAGLEFIREAASAIFAVQYCERHSIGVSIDYYLQRFKAKGIENFEALSSNPDSVTDRNYDYARGCGVTVGWKSILFDWLTVGIAYSPKTHMQQFHKYSGFLAQGGRLDVQGRLLGGIALNLIPCATICFDVEHIYWNRVRSLHNPLMPNIFTSKLGNEDGAGFGFRPQNIYRVGMDYQVLDCLTLRAGYRFGKSFIRRSQTFANLLILETVEQYITVGATWEIQDCLELSTFYAHGFQHTIHGRGSIPDFPFGGGEADLRLHREVFGISAGYNF